MIGVLNRSVFCLVFCLLFASCKNFDTENGRYTVVERIIAGKKDNQGYSREFSKEQSYEYYLLDTKTGKMKKINFSKLPTDTKH